MLKIGITGGIGSGKTTVCKIFETLGIPVFYADSIAKQIMITDPVLMEGLKSAFGNRSFFENGTLNNKHIAQIVFNNIDELKKLNALVHPAVFRAFENWIEEIPATVPYVLKEAALLFESGSYKMCDKSILVTSPMDLKLKRVMQRDSVSETEVKVRIDKQLDDDSKAKLADYFIENKENKSVIMQVLDLHQQFLSL